VQTEVVDYLFVPEKSFGSDQIESKETEVIEVSDLPVCAQFKNFYVGIVFFFTVTSNFCKKTTARFAASQRIHTVQWQR
jgi:hypothetical protein